MGGVARRLVRLVEITDGTAVAHYEVLEAPLVAQDGLQQPLGPATGVVVESLVGTHHLTHLGILHQRFESRQISLPHVAWRDVGEIGRVASVFRPAMHGKVLCAGPELAILGILWALQATHHLGAHDARQVGVFTVGLLSTPPTWVAEDVHVGRPHREAVELLVLATAPLHALVVLCTKFRRSHVEAFV